VNYTLDVGDWGYIDGRKWDERERERERIETEADDRGLRTGLQDTHRGRR
jgi:hypothetical protein